MGGGEQRDDEWEDSIANPNATRLRDGLRRKFGCW
jgi:hypothetical protein